MRQLFGSRRACLAVLLVLLAAAVRVARADDDVSLKLHNDTSQAIDVYVASEKSQAEKPWTHLRIEADADGECAQIRRTAMWWSWKPAASDGDRSGSV